MRASYGLLLTCLLAFPTAAQVCRLSVAGLNQNRRVIGPVTAECPPTIHTPPFGNWGVSSPFGVKGDSRQFEGWCRNSRVCDNFGQCQDFCGDDNYEWNSCTDLAAYRPPNCSLYNTNNCTEQSSVTGINVHGTKIVDLPVSCPRDLNSDGFLDEGGCAEVRSYSSGVNFMSLYELDPGTGDELVQSLYFPEVMVGLQCNALGCKPAGSQWVAPVSYDSPASPPKVFAEMAMVLNSGTFVNTANACQIPELRADIVSAASFRGTAAAPDSISTAFGQSLATGTASATSVPLPTTLAGTTVSVIDTNGTSRNASLFYASPEQVNFLVPAGTLAGNATIAIRRSDGITARGTVQAGAVAPGLFTANASGEGVAAGHAVRVAANGTQTVERIFECAPAPGTCLAVPVALSTPPEKLILVLFGTGVRNHAAAGGISVSIAGLPAEVLYAGPQGEFVGLDQINAVIPMLPVRGEVNIIVSAGQLSSNPVSITVQ